MDARLFLLSCLLCGTAAIAQNGEPDKTPATPPAGQAPAGTDLVDQDKPKKTAAEEIAELTREKERLEREIAYAQERAKSAKADLAAKLGRRGQELHSIKFELPKPMAMTRPQARPARVMNDAERESNGADVLMVVNGVPVMRGQVEELTNYLQSAGAPGDATVYAQRVAFELLRTTSVAAAFPENPAEGQMAEVLGKIQQGAKVTDLVAQVGTVPGAQPDGTVEVTRSSFLGVKFEQVAFSLEPGQHARPFLAPQGWVILQGLERKKNDVGQDIAKVAALLIPWQASPDELQAAQSAAATGQVDILVRDTGVLEMLPAIYRPRIAPVGDSQVNSLTNALARLDAEIAELEKKDDPTAQKRLESLRAQRNQLVQTIDSLRDPKARPDADKVEGDVTKAPAQKPDKK
ncbi:MAG: peptidylprolyl isomerase [Planctomycetes bacterium]|nr:peptidylprolyl isomerase [Planctomycetota bacterium]MCB9886138.1 peptidylprolyl isomerase [Planctomycetota bacterium]